MVQVIIFWHYDCAKQYWTGINYNQKFEFQSFPAELPCGMGHHSSAGRLLLVTVRWSGEQQMMLVR